MQAKFIGNVHPEFFSKDEYMTVIPWREDPVQFAPNRAALKRQIFANRNRAFRLYIIDDNFNYVLKFAVEEIPGHLDVPANKLDAWLDDLLA